MCMQKPQCISRIFEGQPTSVYVKEIFFFIVIFQLNSMLIDEIGLVRYHTDFHGFLSSTLGDIEENPRKMAREFMSSFRKVPHRIQ